MRTEKSIMREVSMDSAKSLNPTTRPTYIPVIFDTDIGCDIDDTWALVYFILIGGFDPLLVTSERGNSEYRLRIVARMLGILERDAIPLGYGAPRVKGDRELEPQRPWVRGFPLGRYSGKIHRDGVGALIETVMSSPEEVSVVTIGPLTNIARAIEREPRIANRMRLYSMAGSIYEGLADGSAPYPETNVRKDIGAARYVLESGVRLAISPIESAKRIMVGGESYMKLRESRNLAIKGLLETYRIWTTHPIIVKRNPPDPGKASTALYDVQAVYMASIGGAENPRCENPYFETEEIRIRIDAQGYSRLDPHGYAVTCATRWKDLDGFIDHFTGVLCSVPS